jgi:dienelactone hydrolase
MKWNGFSRREMMMLTASTTAAMAASPQSAAEGQTLDGFYYRDYSRCLPNYIGGLAQAAYTKREQAIGLVKTPGALQERQVWSRETLWKLIGGTPERTPLNAHTLGRFEREGYVVEKVIYESRPGIVVSANLYLPKSGKAPHPGVLFQLGHSPNGKAYPSYQKCCQGLAQLGFVVLAFDPMGQGERIGYLDESGKHSRLESVDDEHSVPGKQLILIGDTASRFQLWDAIRSLDYLAAHPSVDPKRLATTGQSGGATVSMLLACVDDRLSAAAICSGNTENVAAKHFDSPGATDDAEQDFIGSGTLGFDRWDLLYPFAPKPLLIQVSAHDFFGTYSPTYLDDGREHYEQLAQCYALSGSSDKIAWRSTPLPHGLTYSFRLDVYNWFERWLKGSTRKIEEEPHVHPEKDETLWVGPTGNVQRDFHSLRPFDVILKQTQTITPGSSGREWKKEFAQENLSPDRSFSQLASTKLAGATVVAAEVEASPQIWIPSWLFVPRSQPRKGSILLALDDRGRNARAHEDDVYHRLSQSGKLVCAADLRGIGDVRPEAGRGNPAYTIPHTADDEYAWASLILGEPMLKQRINDIIALVSAVKKLPEAANAPITLAARGGLTVPALFAFALMQQVDSLYLCGGLASFKSLLETESYTQPLANYMWNLYSLTDLPIVASGCAPRKIHVAGAVDGAGKALASQRVKELYSGPHIAASERASWDFEALSEA